ncbi:hypothetical protein PPROV_000562200 [Pycnococcus provasolii]|uniref:Ubiquitin-like domain-containing protein n=2 Tax=Pycnococcus provasolii TaxID=41880 RepID=A0A830HJ35_9CHLO|nr:hypothetical protein PPROV_000562200 [Pycnococcus provasolii]
MRVLLKNPYASDYTLCIPSSSSGSSSSSSSCVSENCASFSSCSVLDLKKLIEEKYPSHPSVKAQKLIFSGAILSDAALLSELAKSMRNIEKQFVAFDGSPMFPRSGSSGGANGQQLATGNALQNEHSQGGGVTAGEQGGQQKTPASSSSASLASSDASNSDAALEDEEDTLLVLHLLVTPTQDKTPTTTPATPTPTPTTPPPPSTTTTTTPTTNTAAHVTTSNDAFSPPPPSPLPVVPQPGVVPEHLLPYLESAYAAAYEAALHSLMSTDQSANAPAATNAAVPPMPDLPGPIPPDPVHAAIAAAAAAGGNVRVIRIDLRLIAKLIVLVLVLNQDGSRLRLALFSAVAVLIYLHQTGALNGVGRRLAAFQQSALGLDAPAQRGVLHEVKVFLVGFLTSLLPGFSVGDGGGVAAAAGARDLRD